MEPRHVKTLRAIAETAVGDAPFGWSDAATAALNRITSLERQLAESHNFIKANEQWYEFVNKR